jgi:hypothetical protein
VTAKIDPVQFDTELFKWYQEHANLDHQLESLFNFKIHPLAGDKEKSLGWGRGRSWGLDDEDALAIVRRRADEDDVRSPQLGVRPSEAIARHDQVTALMQTIWGAIVDAEQVWQEHRWTRWFPCLNSDGHVHHTMRGCPTIRWETQMGWATELSGTPLEVAIQMPPVGLGPRLCSVCFPQAPVEHCRSLLDITKADREAAKAARQEAKYVKQLRPAEMTNPDGAPLKDGSGWRIETVAACEKALRDEVERRNCFGRGPSHDYADYLRAAELVTRILLGRGYEQASIDKIVDNAVKRNRRAGARI